MRFMLSLSEYDGIVVTVQCVREPATFESNHFFSFRRYRSRKPNDLSLQLGRCFKVMDDMKSVSSPPDTPTTLSHPFDTI